MKRVLSVAAVAVMVTGMWQAGGVLAESGQGAADLPELLRLERLVDGQVAQSVVLFGTATDPNVSSIDDRFRLEVNGREVAAPQGFLARLAQERRAYSYDHFTQGITESQRKALCMMGGPAVGDRLSTLYLTYGKDLRDTSFALRPVLSEPGNCLFAEEIAPKEAQAMLAATKALASLQTLLEMQGE